MKNNGWIYAAALAAASLGIAVSAAQADSIAYSADSATGVQPWLGNLGLDFHVSAPITIDALGAYDSMVNGMGQLSPTNSVQVAIYQFTPGPLTGPDVEVAQVVGPKTIDGTGGAIVGGFYFNSVSKVVLGPGDYSVVAVGFNGTNQNGNENVVTGTGVTPHGLPGVTYTGSGRFDSGPTGLDFPTMSDAARGYSNSAHVFAAGDFAVAVPLPRTATLGFAMLGGFGVLAGLRKRFFRTSRIA